MIQDVKKAELLQVCRELGIPDPIGEGVFMAALQLHEFEEDRGRFRRSPAQRCRDLESVARLARHLNTAVQGLDFDDRRCIDSEFEASALQIHLDPPNPLEAVFRRDLRMSNVLRIGDVLLTLAAIAHAQRETVAEPERGGAPPVLRFHAQCLTEVARLAHLHGIKLGQNQDFLCLCEAIFKAAGVTSGPENAIRYFMREMAPVWLPIWEREREELAPGDAPAPRLYAVKTPPKKGR